MDSNDVQIGERLQALRGPVISQAGLANAMKERGHDKWSQATVWSVEQGKRPLRLAEAFSLADFLQVDVNDLVRTDPDAVAFERLRLSLRDALFRSSYLKDAVRDYLQSRAVLQAALSEDGEHLERGVEHAATPKLRRANGMMLDLAREVAGEAVDDTVRKHVEALADDTHDARVAELLAEWERRRPLGSQKGHGDGVDL